MIEQYQAYLGETEKHHMICGWCPDKADAEKQAMMSEQNKVFIEHMKDNFSYQVKTLSHGICAPCKEKVLDEHRRLINNN